MELDNNNDSNNKNINNTNSKNSVNDSLFSDFDIQNSQIVNENLELCSSNQKPGTAKLVDNSSNEKSVDINKESISEITPKPLKILSNREITSSVPVKRGRKTNTEASQIKLACRRSEKPIDMMFKKIGNVQVQSPRAFSPVAHTSGDNSNSAHDFQINNSLQSDSNTKPSSSTVKGNPPINNEKNRIVSKVDQPIVELKERIKNLEQELDICNKEKELLLECKADSRECFKKILIEKVTMERAAAKEKVNNNKLYLGQFINIRQGAHYEQKLIGGLKFEDLERRKKEIEEQREENEKRRKALNKSKPGNDKGRQVKNRVTELDLPEFFIQAEIHDINRLNHNKEEKDLQMELEYVSRERNSHIREIRRMENEETSRYRNFPILNDRYLILSLLGKGGFSEVHKAFDFETRRFVACKIHELNSSWTLEKRDSYIRHALREISIHKRLDHRRIVRVHDVFNIDNDAFCTVLELCEGNDLDFYLKQNKCMPERDAKSLICQVVSALYYLNDRKNPIIHYDLKPGNILLCNNGEIKITDFGLSKIFPDNNPEGMELTSQGAGTYWYLPPECFVTENGPPTISSKVDVWSVGVIFYQILYGEKPFGNNMTQSDILHNNTILQAKHIDFPTNPKVSEASKDFIRRCCTYSKELRPDVFQIYKDDYLKPKSQLTKNLI